VIENETVIRNFYEARARRDLQAIRALLTDDVRWHEPGDFDYSGDYVGVDAVASLLARLLEVTGGDFRLEAGEMISTAQHVAAVIRWTAGRAGKEIKGTEIAVYRTVGARIAEVWFFTEHDPGEVAEVFSYESS